jgi:hypothetical protein
MNIRILTDYCTQNYRVAPRKTFLQLIDTILSHMHPLHRVAVVYAVEAIHVEAQ